MQDDIMTIMSESNVPDLVPRNLEPEILSLRFGACDLVPKREI